MPGDGQPHLARGLELCHPRFGIILELLRPRCHRCEQSQRRGAIQGGESTALDGIGINRDAPAALEPSRTRTRDPHFIVLTQRGRLSYKLRVTETLTIRLPKSLAREFRVKTRAANTNPTEVLRQAAARYVRDDPTASHAIVEHLRARAGTWASDVSGEELMRKTRP